MTPGLGPLSPREVPTAPMQPEGGAPSSPPPNPPMYVVQQPPPRRLGLVGIFAVLVGGVFLGSTCSTCATMQANREGPFAPDGPRVGVVEVVGSITASREVVEDLADFASNDDIEAVVLRVDSPGGTVGPSQEIYEAVRRTARTKPVVASMGAVAASGGYWIALAADEIFANPGTITGSIGVIVQIPDLTGLAELLRFDLRVYKSGPRKDLGNPLRPEAPADRAVFQALVDDIYAQFVELVMDRRGLPRDAVEDLADGRVLSGAAARAAGLVDHLGGLETAARRALVLAEQGVGTATTADPSEAPILVYPPPAPPPILQLLGASLSEGVSDGVGRAARRTLEGALDPGVELR